MAIYPIATHPQKPGTSSKLLDSPLSSTGHALRRASLEYDPAYAGRNDKKVIATQSLSPE